MNNFTIPSSFNNGVFTPSQSLSVNSTFNTVTIPSSFSPSSGFTPSQTLPVSTYGNLQSITIPSSFSNGVFTPSQTITKFV